MYKLAIRINATQEDPVHGQIIAYVCGAIGAAVKFDTTMTYVRSVRVYAVVEDDDELLNVKRVLRRLQRGEPKVSYSVEVHEKDKDATIHDPIWKWIDTWFDPRIDAY